jgi:hypothetical protein
MLTAPSHSVICRCLLLSGASGWPAAYRKKPEMKTFDVQSIGIGKSVGHVFDFIATPANLPTWTHAFKRADAKSAELMTPNGAVLIDLETITDESRGTIDWRMTFPDGTVTLLCEERDRSGPHGFSSRRDGLAPRGHRRGA